MSPLVLWLGVALAGVLEADEWALTPEVVVCEQAPWRAVQVQQALNLWAKHGAPQLQARDLGRGCDDREIAADGVVVVDHRWHELDGYWIPDAIAQTMTNSLVEPRKWAVLHFDTRHRDLDFLVLLHEVGHLWFQDVEDPSHIMYGLRIEGGNWSFDGVREAFDRRGGK